MLDLLVHSVNKAKFMKENVFSCDKISNKYLYDI